MSTSSPPSLALNRSSVQSALEIIQPLIHRTPIFTSSSLSASLPGQNSLYFKAENLQKGGAFKFRGASYSLSCLTKAELEKGVCTHSSGEQHFCDISLPWSGAFCVCGVQGTMRVPWRSLQKSAL